MADPGSIDDFLSSEIDENAVNALVGSLETQLASPASTQATKSLSDSSYNNNHIGNTTSTVNASSRPLFLANQTVAPKGLPVSNNSAINSHVSVSVTPKLSGSDILGISSIINSSSTPVCSGSVAHVNVNTTSVGTNGRNTEGQKKNITPTIRIVTQPTSTSVSTTNTTQFITTVGSGISPTVVPALATNNVHVHGTTMGAVTRTSSSAASSTIFNLANTIAAEQKPVTVVHNGSAHSIQVCKDRAIIPQQQFIIKQEGTSTAKQEGSATSQPFIVKAEPGSTTVHLKQEGTTITPVMPGSSPVSVSHSGTIVNTTLKGVTGTASPSVITVRPHLQQQVVVQSAHGIVTTQAAMSQPMQVVNVSATQAAPRLASVAQVKQGMRVATPIRIAQPPNIAPRQPGPTGSTGTIAIPHGTLLMRNEAGQLVLVSAGQPGGAIHPGGVITPSVPITTTAGFKIQRPAVTQTAARPTGAIVTIHPPGSQTRTQPVNITQQSVPRVITQASPNMPSPTIAQPQPAVVTATAATTLPASGSDQNRVMLENVKKCKNFLSTLLKLAANQPAETVRNVRDLIQGLIDSKVEPEIFTERLQCELKSSPQPYLVPFLKKSLPMLRQSMQTRNMVIEGIKPPPSQVLMTPSVSAVQRPPQVVTSATVQTKAMPQPPRPQMPVPVAGPQAANKVVVQTVRPAAPTAATAATTTATAVSSARPRVGGASAAVTAALQAHTQKSEAAGQAASAYREKRKFEALKDDNDDINDVATMGGVNLSEESKNILATNSELIGTQIRSCKDESFLPHSALMARITAIAKKQGMDDVSADVASIISHATQERLRTIVAKLSTIAEHRVEVYKMDGRYEPTTEVKSQLKFLEELDRLEKKRHEEQEREMLLRAIKSRSKNEDPEQLKLKQKAKELQQAEAEEVRQRDANLTALAAIGPRKKRKLDSDDSGLTSGSIAASTSNGPSISSSRSVVMSRPRIKRVNLRDMIYLMEQDPTLCKSSLLYQTFLK